MKKLLILFPIVAIGLTACDDVSERDCGTFNHPALEAWQPYRGEATLTYTSSEGISKVFNRQRFVKNEPYLAADGSSNDEDVRCQLTATARMLSTDNTLAITTTYTQEEQSQLDEEDEILLLDHRIESQVGGQLTTLAGNYPADISENQTRFNPNPDRVQYLTPEQAVEFDGQAYEDAIRIYGVGRKAPDPDANPATDSTTPSTTVSDPNAVPAATDVIQQIVVAKGVGILAFTDEQGRQFVLVP